MKTSLVIAAAVIAAAVPAIASAQPPRGSIAVSYRDLDLGSEAGRQSLQSRISGAVRRVCGHSESPGLKEWAERERCLRETAARGLAQARTAIARASRERLSGAALAAR